MSSRGIFILAITWIVMSPFWFWAENIALGIIWACASGWITSSRSASCSSGSHPSSSSPVLSSQESAAHKLFEYLLGRHLCVPRIFTDEVHKMRVNNCKRPEHKSDDVVVCPSCASIAPNFVDQGLEPVVRLCWLLSPNHREPPARLPPTPFW